MDINDIFYMLNRLRAIQQTNSPLFSPGTENELKMSFNLKVYYNETIMASKLGFILIYFKVN